MRYIVLTSVALLSALLSGSVFTGIRLLGIEPDFMLACMAVMILSEKSLTPMFYMAGAAFLLDIFFSRAIGFYTLQYLITGILAYLFSVRSNVGILGVALLGGLLWVIRDLAGIVFSILINHLSDFGARLLSSTMPGVFLAALLTCALYLLAEKLYKNRFMRPAPLFFKKAAQI